MSTPAPLYSHKPALGLVGGHAVVVNGDGLVAHVREEDEAARLVKTLNGKDALLHEKDAEYGKLQVIIQDQKLTIKELAEKLAEAKREKEAELEAAFSAYHDDRTDLSVKCVKAKIERDAAETGAANLREALERIAKHFSTDSTVMNIANKALAENPATEAAVERQRLAFIARRGDSPVEPVNPAAAPYTREDALLEAIDCLIVGACAVAVPHEGERKVLQDAVDMARATVLAASPQADAKQRQESIRLAAVRALKEEVRRLEKENRRLAVATPPPVTAETLAEAMQTEWDDYCGDANCIPSCISVHGPGSTRISANFTGSSFADRVAERLAVKSPVSAAIADIMAERERQKRVEGWTEDHDDRHEMGELAAAASCYAFAASIQHRTEPVDGTLAKGTDVSEPRPSWWPWSIGWWKPTTRRRDLVKAGGLIIAAIEREDRIKAKKAKSHISSSHG